MRQAPGEPDKLILLGENGAATDPPPTRPSTWISRLTLGQVALIAASIGLIWALSGVILMIFFAVLIAASLRGAADFVQRHTRIPNGLALVAVVLVVFGLLGGLAWWIGPNLFRQLGDLSGRLHGEFDSLRSHFSGSPLMSGGPNLQQLAERVVGPAASVFSFSLSTLTELLVALVTALYFAAAPDLYVGGVVRLAPIRYRLRLREVMQTVAHSLRLWLLGQLIDMTVVGALAAVGLWLVGVPVPFALGVVSGLFTFVPYVGTIISGALAVVIALSNGFSTALWALGVFAVCHVVEGYVIAPLIQRRILELPPALTLLSMTALGALFGISGIILGTPLTAAGLVVVQALYIGDVLGDHSTDPTKNAA